MASPRAVLFDWRGTLAAYLSDRDWVRLALSRAGRSPDDRAAAAVLDALDAALTRAQPAGWDRADTSAALHRQVHENLFAAAGLDADLAACLYEVMSDTTCDQMAEDVPATLSALAGFDVRIVIVSDIHVDLRPWFARHGLDHLVDGYVLSFEHGVQKPDPEMFELALTAAGVCGEDALMVGDRPGYDGGAVALGVPTLLLPPLTSAQHQRLHLVQAAVTRSDG